jgi:hypothetical protein
MVTVPLGHHVVCEVASQTAQIAVRKIVLDHAGNQITNPAIPAAWTIEIYPTGNPVPPQLTGSGVVTPGRSWVSPEFVKVLPAQNYRVRMIPPTGVEFAGFELIDTRIEVPTFGIWDESANWQQAINNNNGNVIALGAPGINPLNTPDVGLVDVVNGGAGFVPAALSEPTDVVYANLDPLAALEITFVSQEPPPPPPDPDPTPTPSPTPDTPGPTATPTPSKPPPGKPAPPRPPLAVTGAEIAGILTAAAATLTLGGLMFAAARRRKHRKDATTT